MPRTESAKGRVRTTRTRTARNTRVRSTFRTAIRQFSEAVQTGAEQATAKLRAAVSEVDKAASKGVIHKGQASRRKSRLMRKMSKAQAAAKEA